MSKSWLNLIVVYEAIAKIAKERGADLIIMGSQGSSGTEEMLIGSNTERVIRSSEVPVLTIKNVEEPLLIKDIVFASNFFEESYVVFNQIKKFARLFDSHIHLLKVVTPSYFETTHYSLKLMEDFAKKIGLETNYSVNIYNDQSIEQGIHHFAEVVNADLIAMETHGRTGLRHMIWGSITEGVANHAKMPVLSVRIPKGEDKGNVIFPE
jgi:nucleotide-binding universal stress UspA family protein